MRQGLTGKLKHTTQSISSSFFFFCRRMLHCVANGTHWLPKCRIQMSHFHHITSHDGGGEVRWRKGKRRKKKRRIWTLLSSFISSVFSNWNVGLPELALQIGVQSSNNERETGIVCDWEEKRGGKVCLLSFQLCVVWSNHTEMTVNDCDANGGEIFSNTHTHTNKQPHRVQVLVYWYSMNNDSSPFCRFISNLGVCTQ